jgi:hypothetical protein
VGAEAVAVGAEAVAVGAVSGAAFGASLFEQPTTAKAATTAETAMMAEIFFMSFHLLSHPDLTSARR